MKLHHLRPADGAVRERKRVGRGKAAGQGKTAGRGTKGYLARHNTRLGFEGGQVPLQRRVPKLKGFKNPTKVEFEVVNVERLGQLFDAGAEVTPEVLVARRVVRAGRPVKLLGRGELDRSLTVRVHAASASATAKVEQAGGTVTIL